MVRDIRSAISLRAFYVRPLEVGSLRVARGNALGFTAKLKIWLPRSNVLSARVRLSNLAGVFRVLI